MKAIGLWLLVSILTVQFFHSSAKPYNKNNPKHGDAMHENPVKPNLHNRWKREDKDEKTKPMKHVMIIPNEDKDERTKHLTLFEALSRENKDEKTKLVHPVMIIPKVNKDERTKLVPYVEEMPRISRL